MVVRLNLGNVHRLHPIDETRIPMKPCSFQIWLDLAKTKNDATFLFVNLINTRYYVCHRSQYNAQPDHALRRPFNTAARGSLTAE